MDQPPPPDILSFDWGWDNIRRDVFQLVAWGYQLTELEIRQRHLEEEITGLIRKGINEKLDFDFSLPFRFGFYSAHNEDPVDDGGILGKDRPRVDILIECSGGQPRKRYRLEAKRCARNENPIGWYTKGVIAFVERRYARDSPEAALLGLMQSDDAKHWKSQLGDKLNVDTTLACLSTLTDVDITPDIPDVTYSIHRRNDDSEIVLYHAFLDCT